MTLELYINNERVDLFNDETISFTSNVKSTKGIDKVLTDFSQQFNLPATKINNRIFKHYYKYDIVNGYDARFSVDAFIKLNGFGFNKGTLRLNTVDIRDGEPYSYKVVFFGKAVNLKNRIGEDRLPQLQYLNKFQHEYNLDVVRDGFEVGLGFQDFSSQEPGTLVRSLDRDIIYPLISHTKQFYFDSSTPDDPQINGYNLSRTGLGSVDDEVGINFVDLKPAIKLIRIIEAIEEQYSIEFSRDFFGTPEFDKLYMWLHRDKGPIRADSANETSQIIILNDQFNFINSLPTTTGDIRDEVKSYYNYGTGSNTYDVFATYLDYKITPNDLTKPYSLRVYDDISGDEITQAIQLDGVGQFSGPQYIVGSDLQGEKTIRFLFNGNNIVSPDYQYYKPRLVFETPTDDGVTSIDVDLEIKYRSNIGSSSFQITNTSFYDLSAVIPIVKTIYCESQIPNYKVIDFIKSLFNMFNLVIYSNKNNFLDEVITVNTLDNFYRTGNKIDISRYINTDKQSVGRIIPYSSIEYKYEKPSTFLAKQRDKLLSGIPFGDLNFDSGLLNKYDGGKYSVKVNFEHMLFERLTDLGFSNNIYSNVGWGWFVDENEEPAIGEPLIFINEPTNNADIAFYGNTDSIDNYNRPSNNATLYGQTNNYSINFGSESDEFNLQVNDNSLFQIYHSNYIGKIFDSQARKLKTTAVLPPNFLLNFNLNDVLIINNREFIIDKIKTNLSNGKSDMELRNVILDEVPINRVVDAPQISLNLQSIPQNNSVKNLIISFDPNDFESTSPFYYYVNGVKFTLFNLNQSSIVTQVNVGEIYSIFISDGEITSETKSILV